MCVTDALVNDKPGPLIFTAFGHKDYVSTPINVEPGASGTLACLGVSHIWCNPGIRKRRTVMLGRRDGSTWRSVLGSNRKLD